MSEMSLTSQFMDFVFRLPKHVCVCTHEYLQKKKDRGSGDVTVVLRQPLFTGNNRESIPTMFDNVWWVSPKETGQGIIAQVHTVPDDNTYAKTRMGGVLPPIMRDPDLTKVIEKMKTSAESAPKKRK